jgi:hypothetical protein
MKAIGAGKALDSDEVEGGWGALPSQGLMNARERQARTPVHPLRSHALTTSLQAGWQDERQKVGHNGARLVDGMGTRQNEV